MTTVKRSTPTAATLENIYTVVREIIPTDVYYSADQVEELKKDKNNIFLERRQNGERMARTEC